MFDLNLTKINNFGLSVLPHSKFNYFITIFCLFGSTFLKSRPKVIYLPNEHTMYCNTGNLEVTHYRYNE